MDMKRYPSLFRTVLPIVVCFFTGAAHASTMIGGVAVDSAGSSTEVGSTVAFSPSPTRIPDAIKYYIPLGVNYKGIYGVAGATGSCDNGHPGSFGGAGTCADYGSGYGYSDSSGLAMNIFFDLSLQPASKSAELSFLFDDLDLMPENDPDGFFEVLLELEHRHQCFRRHSGDRDNHNRKRVARSRSRRG